MPAKEEKFASRTFEANLQENKAQYEGKMKKEKGCTKQGIARNKLKNTNLSCD